MKRFVTFGIVGLLLVTTTGCGGADSLMKDMIGHLNDLAASFEKKEPTDKQKAIVAKMKTTAEKFEKLKLSDAEKDKLEKKYEAEGKAAGERLGKALKDAGPDALPIMMEAAEALMKMGGKKDNKKSDDAK